MRGRPTSGVVATVLLLSLVTGGAAHADDEPELGESTDDLDAALACPATFEASDREPVLLVHGTGAEPRENFGWNLLPQLRADGFDVCTVELPTRALADIQIASEYVVHAVRTIHVATGRPVDIAGHSQGGLEPRWAMAWWPSTREQIDDVVTYASPHDGTVAAEAACAGTRCWPAVHQMRPGSDFLTALWAQEDLAGVDVTSMGSVMDELVQPPETIELPGASNIILQDVCPARPVTHVSIVADAVAYALLLDAFTSDGPAEVARLPDGICQETFIEEASPEHLLDPDSTSGYRDGSFLDPAVPRSMLSAEEPALADYARADEPADDESGPAEDDAASGDGDDEPGPAVDADEAEAARGTLPATGGGAAALAVGLLALAVGIGRHPRRR